MQEALWVLGLLLVIAAYAAARFLLGEQIVIVGEYVMLGAAAVGLPLELLYFLLLGAALQRNGGAPKGWYWRSFAHHELLTPTQRRWVLPPFYVGALSFLAIVLGIAIVFLGFAVLLGAGGR